MLSASSISMAFVLCSLMYRMDLTVSFDEVIRAHSNELRCQVHILVCVVKGH